MRVGSESAFDPMMSPGTLLTSAASVKRSLHARSAFTSSTANFTSLYPCLRAALFARFMLPTLMMSKQIVQPGNSSASDTQSSFTAEGEYRLKTSSATNSSPLRGSASSWSNQTGSKMLLRISVWRGRCGISRLRASMVSAWSMFTQRHMPLSTFGKNVSVPAFRSTTVAFGRCSRNRRI